MSIDEVKLNIQQLSQQSSPIAPVSKVDARNSKSGASQLQNNAAGMSFSEVLSKIETNKHLQFSKHAEMRLASRDINFTNEQISRIESGISKAKEKGIKDSLVLVDDVALLVNVRNNIVITAVDKQNDSIFTNIDGAVIV